MTGLTDAATSNQAELAALDALRPEDYDGTPICPRCGSGWPDCSQGFTHAETCARYEFADDPCPQCAADLEDF